RDAESRGVFVHIALAATRTTAMVLALARPGVTVVGRGREAAAIAAGPVPMVRKNWGPFSQNPPKEQNKQKHPGQKDFASFASFAVLAFHRWGVHTFGELASLPAADLLARLGPPARTWQAIARGEDLRPLIPTLADERFDSSMELEWPIEGLE